MTASPASMAWYGAHALALADAYEALDPARVHDWLADLLPPTPALVLDVGAGTGRDAAWLARLGHDAVAVEPSAAMRAEGERRHAGAGVRWMSDSLPALSAIHRLGLAFDVILLGGVWQHVASGERERAMRKLLGLLRPGGVLALTLQHGPSEPGGAVHPVSPAEVERLAREHGAVVVRATETLDHMGRSGVSWTGVALRLPDDGTGALPLLRHVILNDQKSATYKLGLLRALCRAADGQVGMAEARGEDAVALPLDLVALNRLRLYLPLVEAGLPQAPGNTGSDGAAPRPAGARVGGVSGTGSIRSRCGSTRPSTRRGTRSTRCMGRRNGGPVRDRLGRRGRGVRLQARWPPRDHLPRRSRMSGPIRPSHRLYAAASRATPGWPTGLRLIGGGPPRHCRHQFVTRRRADLL